MAQGTITVSNFCENTVNVLIVGDQGGKVATGTLAPHQTSGFLVSGFEEYGVSFANADDSGAITASNLTPDSIVQFEITGR